MLYLSLQRQPFRRSTISYFLFDYSPPIFKIIWILNQTYNQNRLQEQINIRQICLQIYNKMKTLACLGAGSFGTVYKVQIEGALYAIKRIALEFDSHEESLEIATINNQVNLITDCLYHPNIVRCYTSFRKQDYFYIVMQYVGHQSLNDVPFPLPNQKQVIHIIIQLAMGLKHLKNNHIIHRDIKPKKGLLKIADFGISKRLNKSQGANTCLGTPFYTAPEIIQEQEYGYAVDVWSLGVIIYECIHGCLPFTAYHMSDLKRKIRLVTPYIREDLDQGLQYFLKGCLAKHPDNRLTVQQILKIPIIRHQMQEQIRNFVKYF